MQNNVIFFNRSCETTPRASAETPSRRTREKIVSLDEWKGRPRALRTASGVFFTTGVLCTLGSVA